MLLDPLPTVCTGFYAVKHAAFLLKVLAAQSQHTDRAEKLKTELGEKKGVR